LSQAFNQRSVDALRPRIRVIADELLDAVSGRDSFDVVAEYARPLPIIVIAEMLGVDAGDLARFKRWSDARSQVFNIARTPEQAAESATARQELDDYFARAVDERRGRRGTDLISALVSAQEAADRLTQREIVTTCNLLLVAGNLTTTDATTRRGIPILTASILSGRTQAISPLVAVRISAWGAACLRRGRDRHPRESSD
jgi:cytochrome P450